MDAGTNKLISWPLYMTEKKKRAQKYGELNNCYEVSEEDHCCTENTFLRIWNMTRQYPRLRGKSTNLWQFTLSNMSYAHGWEDDEGEQHKFKVRRAQIYGEVQKAVWSSSISTASPSH